MKGNVGGIDRGLRIAVGIGLLSILFFAEGSARWWGLVGIVPLFTGLAGWCPVYPMLGLNTCPATRGR